MKNKNSGFSDRNKQEDKSQGKKKMPPQTKGDKYPLKNRYYNDDEDEELEDFSFDEDDNFSDDDEDEDY